MTKSKSHSLRALLPVMTAAALIGATVCAYADDKAEAEKGCDSGVTVEMVECLNAKTAEWDKRLNAAYPKALKLGSARQRDQLRKAQRAWIVYRDANCLYRDLGEGTMARLEAADCIFTMTKARAEQLEDIVDAN